MTIKDYRKYIGIVTNIIRILKTVGFNNVTYSYSVFETFAMQRYLKVTIRIGEEVRPYTFNLFSIEDNPKVFVKAIINHYFSQKVDKIKL